MAGIRQVCSPNSSILFT